jgi:hypothetical protein
MNILNKWYIVFGYKNSHWTLPKWREGKTAVALTKHYDLFFASFYLRLIKV